MIEIHLSSDAFSELRLIMQSPDTYRVRIQEREDGVAIKRNEGTWSPTLATVPWCVWIMPEGVTA